MAAMTGDTRPGQERREVAPTLPGVLQVPPMGCEHSTPPCARLALYLVISVPLLQLQAPGAGSWLVRCPPTAHLSATEDAVPCTGLSDPGFSMG